MAVTKYIIDKSDVSALLRGEELAIQPRGNIRGFCVEIAGDLTNGDVIKALLNPRNDQIKVYGEWVEVEIQKQGFNFSCTLGWWNAPYKAESEVEE